MSVDCLLRVNKYEDKVSLHLWDNEQGGIAVFELTDRLSDLFTGKARFDPKTATAKNEEGEHVPNLMAALQEAAARATFPDYEERIAQEAAAEKAFDPRRLAQVRKANPGARVYSVDIGEGAKESARWAAIRQLDSPGGFVRVVFTDNGKLAGRGSYRVDLGHLHADYAQAANRSGRRLCEKLGFDWQSAEANFRAIYQIKESFASVKPTAKMLVNHANRIAAARHVQSLTDDHAPQPPVDPERGEKVAAFFEGIRSLLADSNLAYPGHDDDGPGSSHHEIREWLEGAVKDELEDHETPLTPDERAAISELTEEVIEFDREQRVLIENFDRQAEAESFKP